MSTASPIIISEDNLSFVWGRALLHMMEHPLSNPAPLVISLTGFHNNIPQEDTTIRDAVDQYLAQHDRFPVSTTAMTIFPYRAWTRRCRPARDVFYSFALTQLLPRLKARCSLNRRGTYFERMMAFQGVKQEKVDGVKQDKIKVINQLEFIIDLLSRGQSSGHRPRQSALQIAYVDPAKDHIGSSRQGFPCLQQVSVGYDNSGGLALSAYYPSQYIFDRAYGNYLGLCHLAEFIAVAVSLSVVRVNFFIAHPELGIPKRDLQPLADIVTSVVGTSVRT